MKKISWNNRKIGKLFGIFGLLILMFLVWYLPIHFINAEVGGVTITTPLNILLNIFLTIGPLLIIGAYIAEILKSPEKEKKDLTEIYQNNIKRLQKSIDYYNNEIKKLK